MEPVFANNQLIAIFIPAQYHPEKTDFMTPLSEPLQCGIGVFSKDKKVDAHRHVGDPATISEFQEFIQIRKGKALAGVYDLDGRAIKTYEMNVGDCLLLLRGGHCFSFLEETELLEIKQGPYLGREKMKQLL